ncbi:hypothetical protein AB0C51_02090 [Streptomyces pathocidini]|uniref:hypothetical protein n=1 Tax=Streptomyces pathocidini TaxID=1650571 RepID=UPI0033F654AF
MADVPASEFETVFGFATPQRVPRGWDLSFDTFTEALRARDPEAFARRRVSPLNGESLLIGFSLPDTILEVIVKVDPDGVVLMESTAAQAAGFAVWLRDNVVPEGAEVEFNVRPAVEAGLPNRPLPTGDASAVEEALLAYVSDILAARARGEM